MLRPLSNGPRRFPIARLWIAMLLFAAVAVACSQEEPTPTSTPTQTPTAAPSATPFPTPDTSVAMEIEFWELDPSSTGQDLVALLTDEEAACLENELGTGYTRMLEAPLAGEAGALLEEGGSDAFPLPRCFTVERGATMSLSLFSAAAGGFSAGTQDCMLQLLTDNPAIGEALGQGQAWIDGPAIQEFVPCLTREEADALVPPGEGPSPTNIACLMRELEGTSSGERLVTVLSVAYTSREGLTTEESAALDRAVAVCGNETKFGFPIPEQALRQDFGPGTYEVGSEIQPVIHVGRGGTSALDSCYWARLKGLSGEPSDIIADGNAIGQFYVEIWSTDEYFKVDCAVTRFAPWSGPEELLRDIQPGTYLVGFEIAAGTYRGSAGTGTGSCSWALLGGLSGYITDINADGNATGPYSVTVRHSDIALSTTCALQLMEAAPPPTPPPFPTATPEAPPTPTPTP